MKFALWVITLSTAALFNLPTSRPQILSLRTLIILYSVIVYTAFVVGLCLLSVSLLRQKVTPFPSPSLSPNRRQTPPRDAVSRLAIWAMALSAGGLFNLPTAKKETQFGEDLIMVYGVTMFFTFNLGWVLLLCFNLPISTACTCPRRLMWVKP